MNDVDGPSVAFAIGALVLVGSAFLSRRVPLGKTVKMLAAWVGIFVLAFLLFSFRSEFSAAGQRMKGELMGTPIQSGEDLRIPIGEDGHYWVRASVNGREERFLIDSGATSTTIGTDFARKAGVEGEGQPQAVNTANGIVLMDRGTATFALGPIERPQMRLMISSQDSINVIGMNFLSSLSSWRVEGHHLVLRP